MGTGLGGGEGRGLSQVKTRPSHLAKTFKTNLLEDKREGRFTWAVPRTGECVQLSLLASLLS